MINPRPFIIAFISLLASAPVWGMVELAAAHFPVRIDIENYGIYRLLEKKERDFDADTTVGYASVVSTRHVMQTEQIALRQGMVFGFNFAITDTAVENQWVPVTIQIKHPATENYLGSNTTGFTQQSGARLKADGRYHNGAFYILSEDYEMVPGEWQISVIYRDQLVASKRFVVE